jgi:hypothetical protein
MRAHVWLAALALSLGLGATAFGQVQYTPFGNPSNGVTYNPFGKPSNAVTYFPFGGANATPTAQQPQTIVGNSPKLIDYFPHFGLLSNQRNVSGVSTFPQPDSQPVEYLKQFGFARLR